jgi:nucleoside-diphosphate-sugar epimerase
MSGSVLITGGAGNLGRYVAQEFEQNYDVTLFDKMRPDAYTHWGTGSQFVWETKLPLVLGDLTDLGDLMRAITFSQCDTIVHVGAMSNRSELVRGIGGQQQRVPEDETMRVNTMGTFYVMDAARRLGVKKVVMISTLSVTGMHNLLNGEVYQVDYLPIDENHPLRPQSTYGLSKLLGEETLAAFTRGYGIRSVVLRPSGIYYPHRENMTLGVTPESGSTSFNPYVYVDARDLAIACRLALDADGLDPFEAFYVNTDTVLVEETRPVLERFYPDLKEKMGSLSGHDQAVSIDKARKKLGYEPKHSWRETNASGHA